MFGSKDRDNTLAAPRAQSKGPDSSTVSIASSDGNDDLLRKSSDGAMDRLKSRQNSDDGRSDVSSSHRRRMSKLFKGRKKSKGSLSQDDVSQFDPNEVVPPVPTIRRPSMGHPYQSDAVLFFLPPLIPVSQVQFHLHLRRVHWSGRFASWHWRRSAWTPPRTSIRSGLSFPTSTPHLVHHRIRIAIRTLGFHCSICFYYPPHPSFQSFVAYVPTRLLPSD